MNPTRVPEDLFDEEGVEFREDPETELEQYKLGGGNGILSKMVRYRPHDSLAMLCLTKKDLYSNEQTAFSTSESHVNSGVGCLSLLRFDPAYDNVRDPDRDKNFLMRSCHMICHEIGHLLGLKNCIYYECLMNGVSSADE